APHQVHVDVDVVAVFGLEGDVVGNRAVSLPRVRVHHQVLLRDRQRVPGVEQRQEEVDPTWLVDLLLAPLLDEAQRAGPHPDLGGGCRAAGGQRQAQQQQQRPTRAGAHLCSPASGAAGAPPGLTPISAQALRTKLMYCSGVITALSMLSNMRAVSRAT